MSLANFTMESTFTDVNTNVTFVNPTIKVANILILPGQSIQFTFDVYYPGGTTAVIKNRTFSFLLTNAAIAGSGFSLAGMMQSGITLLEQTLSGTYTPDSQRN